jgi:hypothetical protein
MNLVLTTPWGPASLLAVIGATFIYMNLSRRLGAVTKMRPYYRAFLVAGGFVILAFTTYVLRNSAFLAGDSHAEWLLDPLFGLLLFHLPLFIGVTINLLLVWRYWSWLLKEDG